MEWAHNEGKTKLFCKMEQIIANTASNSAYRIGSYRYPVHYKKNGKICKTDRAVPENIANYEVLESMYYQFGVHRLDIGQALTEIIELLEYVCPELSEAMETYDEDDYETFISLKKMGRL